MGSRNNWGMQSKMVFKTRGGNMYVIVHKKYFHCVTLLNFGHSVLQITNKPGGRGGS